MKENLIKCGSAPDKSTALSRRNFLKVSALAAMTTSWVSVGERYAFGAGHVPKARAHYQGSPNGGQHCGLCAHFLAPNHCAIVAGKISSNGWCKFFKAA